MLCNFEKKKEELILQLFSSETSHDKKCYTFSYVQSKEKVVCQKNM